MATTVVFNTTVFETSHVHVPKVVLNPFPAAENGPGSRGSRPARMRLSDLGAMRHCTQPFLEHVRCCPRSCVVVASTYSQSVL